MKSFNGPISSKRESSPPPNQLKHQKIYNLIKFSQKLNFVVTNKPN